MAVLLGGRAAETHASSSDVSTGAADDLAKATDIARSMVTRFGMDAKLGQVAYEGGGHRRFCRRPPKPQWQPRWYSDETAAKIDGAVRAIIDAAFQRAVSILNLNRDLVAEGADELLKRETLALADLERYKRRIGARPGAPAIKAS